MTAKTAKTVNFLDLGTQLALAAKGMQKQVKEADRPLSFPASILAKKIKGLEALGNMKIFQMREVGENEYKVSTLTLYRNGEECGVYTPDLELVSDFQIVGFKTGKYGYATLKHKSGELFTAAISYTDDYVMELEESGEDGVEGEGVPPLDALRELPSPETPLWSKLLPLDKELTIISNSKVSKKHQTPLVNVKLPNGDIQKDVLCNSALQSLYERHGKGAKFKIASKKQVERKDKTKVWIVNIIDCQLDLSDL